MNQSEFAKRRKRIAKTMGKGSIAILPAAPPVTRNSDVEYRYRPDSDFYYLTGFSEPHSVCVIAPNNKHGEYLLFCRERDPQMETWTGPRAGLEDAKAFYGADDAFPINDIDNILPRLLENCDRIYYTLGHDATFDQRVIGWVQQIKKQSRAGIKTPREFIALEHLLHEMRLFKSPAEIAVMRKAAKISAQAHIRAMKTCKPGLNECEIEAEILHHFNCNACTEAYPSIVGGGANGCILHYIENNRPLNEGDLLLIDAGAETQCYASDITRTFPVNGRFNNAQKDIYNVVLDAQLAAIEQVKPGNYWNAPHDAAVKSLTKGLIKLGLLKGTLSQLIKNKAYSRFYMHRTGHWLGMDVHDVGDYKLDNRWRLLEPGMVLTVEPGLYIPAGSRKVAKRWWNIGIRIEDDVLVTKNGHEVLSKHAPKTVVDIETMMASNETS
ncbi:MAG: Xaa-Pro aminopeptidase [Gammaproteobacteria bacterium]|nr:Xaa-Pro aminopeptidase [Gammaproteobacteria bacterium]